MTEEEAKQFGAEHNIFTVETSAKTGSNVELAFSAITQEVIYLFIYLFTNWLWFIFYVTLLFSFQCLLINVISINRRNNIPNIYCLLNIFLDLSKDKKWWIPNGRRLGWH